MKNECNFVADFVIGNITFNKPEDFQLSEIIINVLFLETKLEIASSSGYEFREGRSFEFKSTISDLRDALITSCIKVDVQKVNVNCDQLITLDSFTIDWDERLFQKLDHKKFIDYSQLECKDIMYNDKKIGNITLGFQIKNKDEALVCSDDTDGSEIKLENNSHKSLSTKTSQHFVDKCIDEDDILFVIDDNTKNVYSTTKFLSQLLNSGQVNLKSLKAYNQKLHKEERKCENNSHIKKKSILGTNDEIGDNITKCSKHCNCNKKIISDLDNNIESEENLSITCKISPSKTLSHFKILNSVSNLKLFNATNHLMDGKPCSNNNFRVLKDYNNIAKSNNMKCCIDDQIKENFQNQNFTKSSEKYSHGDSKKNILKCKNSIIDKILEEYGEENCDKSPAPELPHLSKILIELKKKYGKPILNEQMLSAKKCIPNNLEKTFKNSIPDPNCKKFNKQKLKKKTTYKLNEPLCLRRKANNTTHRSCLRKSFGVPKHMGWLWNTNKEMVSRGWKPGAISCKIKNLMKHFLKDFPADTLPVFKRDKKIKLIKEQLVQKPTLKLQKCNGQYIITMRPLKSSKDISCSADPYLKMKPIKFIINRINRESDCDDSDNEFNIEFTPPAGLIKPKLLNLPIKACKETQYIEDDFNFKVNYEPVKKKFDKIPGFCKQFVKEYNETNKPPKCKKSIKKKKNKDARKKLK